MEGSDQLESCVKCHRVKCRSVDGSYLHQLIPEVPYCLDLPSVAKVTSSQSSSSEFTVVLDLDRSSPSGVAGVVVSSDSSSREDPDSPHCPDTLSSEGG